MPLTISTHTDHFASAPQIDPGDCAAIAAHGSSITALTAKAGQTNQARKPWPKPPKPRGWNTTTCPSSAAKSPLSK